MKHKTLLLASVAVALVMAMGIAPAWADFTDSSTVTGAMKVNVTPSTDIREWYQEGVKHVVVSNADDASTAVFVRARVFASGALSTTVSGASWSGPDGEGWYVYGDAVDPGKETTSLDIAIKFPPVKSATEPTGAVVGDNYNVVVVYEAIPAQYNADGTPIYDWSFILDSGTESGGN